MHLFCFMLAIVIRILSTNNRFYEQIISSATMWLLDLIYRKPTDYIFEEAVHIFVSLFNDPPTQNVNIGSWGGHAVVEDISLKFQIIR